MKFHVLISKILFSSYLNNQFKKTLLYRQRPILKEAIIKSLTNSHKSLIIIQKHLKMLNIVTHCQMSKSENDFPEHYLLVTSSQFVIKALTNSHKTFKKVKCCHTLFKCPSRKLFSATRSARVKNWFRTDRTSGERHGVIAKELQQRKASAAAATERAPEQLGTAKTEFAFIWTARCVGSLGTAFLPCLTLRINHFVVFQILYNMHSSNQVFIRMNKLKYSYLCFLLIFFSLLAIADSLISDILPFLKPIFPDLCRLCVNWIWKIDQFVSKRYQKQRC